MVHSTDYHDYVFKDGKLIGAFDEMYKNSKNVPWHQDELVGALFSDIDITILKRYHFDSVCEVGCGLGYFSQRLSRELTDAGGQSPQVTGIDISPTAIAKAKMLFPDLKFTAADLAKERPLSGQQFDLVVIKEVFWYVFNDCDKFLNNVCSLIKDGGYLFVSQCFPTGENWVGKEVIDSPQRLKEILSGYVKDRFYCVEYDSAYDNRALLHYLGKFNSNK